MTANKKVIAISVGLLCGILNADPASATQSISCSDLKDDSSINILLGAGPVPNVVDVTISVGERRLTTVTGQPGEQVTKAQSYDDGEYLRIDLVDVQATKRAAIIRLIRRDHKTHPIQIGFVQIEDSVPIGITCEGP